jgi:signal recognition particle subunit SRP54
VFDTLTNRLQVTLQRLRGKGRLTEEDVKEAMREIRRALLEADVNHAVAKDFTERVREKAVGQELLQSLTAAQQVVKLVNDELVELMGGAQEKIAHSSKPPTVVLMVGLQGAGKTTAAAKLARYLTLTERRRPLLVAADVYRPAAIDQLKVLGEQVKVPVFTLGNEVTPQEIVRGALAEARRGGYDYLLVDTAGRLHVDEQLMTELDEIVTISQPDEILLVIDAMTGQDAIHVAQNFHDRLHLTGLILTKLDGDTRGGAALTVRHVTGCPVKFVGTGEKTDALEPFYPDRMASRILGMGDVLTLIEKAQATFDEKEAKDLEAKIRRNEFTLEDFLSQLRQMRNMGPLDQILGMIPGMNKLKNQLQGKSLDEGQLGKVEAIILSMTKEERQKPELIMKSSSRRVRVAKGSGTQVKDVNQLLQRFEEMRKMMKMFSGPGGKKKARGLGELANSMQGNPGLPQQRTHRHKKKR